MSLTAYLERVRAEPFAYGSHDCALFAAGAIQAQTGVDPAEAFRGRYGSLREGLKALKAQGYESHVDLARAVLKPVDRPFAQTGDIAVLNLDRGPALGVVDGSRVFFLSDGGMMHIEFTSPIVAEILRV